MAICQNIQGIFQDIWPVGSHQGGIDRIHQMPITHLEMIQELRIQSIQERGRYGQSIKPIRLRSSEGKFWAASRTRSVAIARVMCLHWGIARQVYTAQAAVRRRQ